MNFWCSKSINISFEMLWYMTIVLITIGMISIFTQYLVSPFSGSSRYSSTLFFLSAPWSWDIKTHKIPSLAFFFHCYIWSIVFDPSINFYISQYLAIFLSWSWYFLLYMLLSFFDAAITYFLAIFHWTVLPTASCLTLLFARLLQSLATQIAASYSFWQIMHFDDISCVSVACLI